MQHAAAAMLEQRDQLRRHAEEVQEAEKGALWEPLGLRRWSRRSDHAAHRLRAHRDSPLPEKCGA